MDGSDSLLLGLAPALTVEEELRFGPLTISPVGRSNESRFREVARRFAEERGASRENQALIACSQRLRPLVPTIWSLFVFACVTYSRRQERLHRGVRFPEYFHLLSISESEQGLIFDSGHSKGFGGVEHVPLRWPVDEPTYLTDGCWDRRIELACALLGRDPERWEDNSTIVAGGMAADLACAAMERRRQRVENVAQGARTYILLASAFEALHALGSKEWHKAIDILVGLSRLEGASTSLGGFVFSKQGIDKLPNPEPGTAATRPMFAIAQLFRIRNDYAHGRVPAEDSYRLPKELNECHVMHAATLILAALLGDDLSRELDCVVPPRLDEELELSHRLDIPFEVLNLVLTDSRILLSDLEEAIVPDSERAPRKRIQVIDPLG